MSKTQGSKVFTIKPHKFASMGTEQAAAMWRELEASLLQIYEERQSTLSYEENYRLAYNLTLYKHGEFLYTKVFEVVSGWLRREGGRIRPGDASVLLEEVRRLYDTHKAKMGMIRDIMLYPNRTYVSMQRKVPVFEQGLETFRREVIVGGGPAPAAAAAGPTSGHGAGASASSSSSSGGPAPPIPGLGGAIRDTLMGHIAAAREARGPVDGGCVRHVARMLTELGQHAGHAGPYRPFFETPLLAATKAFYAKESAEAVSTMGVPDYLRYAEGRLAYERENVMQHLDDSTASELRSRLQGELVGAHAVALTESESGLGRMLASYEAETAAASSLAGEGAAAGAGAASSSSSSSRSAAGGASGVASSGSGSGGSSKAGDVARMYALFRDVKTPIQWRGPSDPAASPAASGSSAAVAVYSGGGGGGGNLRSSNPIGVLRDCVKAHIVARGCAIVVDPESKKNPVSFVQSLIDLKDRFTRLVDDAFTGDRDFHRALKEAFENVMNNPDLSAAAAAASGDGSSGGGPISPNVCAEYLSVYTDEMMKVGFKGLDGASVEDTLDKVITLFRFLSDKDVFEAHYKLHLQRRLLSGRSTSEEAEAAMLSRLKHECGFQYTSKLEGMFNDLRTSADFMKGYRVVRGPVPDGHVEMDVQVLTSVYWPALPEVPCTLPAEVAASAEAFKTYYLGKHTGRKLTWAPGKGTAELRARFPNGKAHELVVSTYQMAALMAFNGAEALTYTQIKAATGIADDGELRRHLMSLCVPKVRVLVRSGKGRDIEEGEMLTVNPDFDSKMFKVKVPLISANNFRASSSAGGGAGAGGGGEGGDVSADVIEARKHLLEAAIVRIMKARKSMDHASLVAEVLRQVSSRFTAQPPEIKKRIESLIDRDYLERDKNAPQVYNYQAA